METGTIYVDVPARLKEALEELVAQNRRRSRGPRTLTGIVVQACDDLLTRELAGYESVHSIEGKDGRMMFSMRDRETQAEQIVRAMADLVLRTGCCASWK